MPKVTSNQISLIKQKNKIKNIREKEKCLNKFLFLNKFLHTGYWKKKRKIAPCNLTTWPILIKIISDFNSMCRNNSKFSLSFFFSDIEMLLTGKEKVFCVLEYAWTQSKQDYAACICERIHKKCRFGHSKKVQNRRQSVQSKRIWMTIKWYHSFLNIL